MARKAYVATFEVEIVFTADEDTDDLDQVATKAMQKAIRDDVIINNGDVDFQVATYLPCGWTKECYCYGSHSGDMTVNQALANTPEYNKALSMAKALQQKGED